MSTLIGEHRRDARGRRERLTRRTDGRTWPCDFTSLVFVFGQGRTNGTFRIPFFPRRWSLSEVVITYAVCRNGACVTLFRNGIHCRPVVGQRFASLSFRFRTRLLFVVFSCSRVCPFFVTRERKAARRDDRTSCEKNNHAKRHQHRERHCAQLRRIVDSSVEGNDFIFVFVRKTKTDADTG